MKRIKSGAQLIRAADLHRQRQHYAVVIALKYRACLFTNAAYTYSRCYAWQKMIDDETCMPQGLIERVNAQQGEDKFHFRLRDLIWQEWNQLGYENYARQYEQTGIFRAPWLRERTGMPEWYYEKHPDERPTNA